VTLIRLLPSELPKDTRMVSADSETSGLYPDDDDCISVVSLAWRDAGGEVLSCAFPFNQGYWSKPDDLERAYFGRVKPPPVPDGFYKNGKPRFKAQRERLYTVEEKREMIGPDINLPPEEWHALARWLLSRPGLIWHNALFDLIMNLMGPPPGLPPIDLVDVTAWDTMVGNKVLDPTEMLGLKETGRRRLGIEPEERDRLKEHLRERRIPLSGKNTRYDLADWDVMEWYAAEDTELALLLAIDQFERMKDDSAAQARFAKLMSRMKTLTRLERRGVPYQAAESLRWAAKLESRVEEMRDIFPFEPTNPQATEFFFGKGRTKKDKPCLGLTPVKSTDAGNASLDGEVLDKLAERDVPWAKQWREYGLVRDSTSKYYRGYGEGTGKDGRLRTRFRQFGTASMRLSCERINLQAIPHDHRLLAGGSELLAIAPSPRKLLYEPEGWVIFTMDLAQAELRHAAMVADCVPMLEILEAGKDPHGETAIGLGLSGGPDDPAPRFDWFKARSVIAKRSNFSLIFGIGPTKFRADLRKQSGIDFGDKVIKEIHRDWNALYPEFKKAINRFMNSARRAGFTPVRDGVRRYYSDKERTCFNCKVVKCRCGGNADDLHKAFNQHVQGNLGEFGQEWMQRADALLIEAGIDPIFGGVLLQTHDSLTVMVPVELVHLVEACADIAREMWKEWFPGVPGGVDVHAGI
jgi:DNA polymerase I-like protein with 3'-5' exonuclease and polymerase domains